MKTKTTSAFTVNLRNYSLESAMQAAYVMADRAGLRFRKKNAVTLLAALAPRSAASPEALAELKSEFFNELLNCELRSLIARRTKKVRDALIAQALTGAASDKSVYAEDPLGISRPWEEKYGRAAKK